MGILYLLLLYKKYVVLLKPFLIGAGGPPSLTPLAGDIRTLVETLALASLNLGSGYSTHINL